MTLNDVCNCNCFDEFSNQEADFIKEFKHWILYLHYRQHFFGRSLLILKEHKTKITELSHEEANEFFDIYKKWENAISHVSNNSNYNCSILISNTEHLVHKSHLHWHFIPRYEREIELFDQIFPADSDNEKALPYGTVEIKTVADPNLRTKISSLLRDLL